MQPITLLCTFLQATPLQLSGQLDLQDLEAVPLAADIMEAVVFSNC